MTTAAVTASARTWRASTEDAREFAAVVEERSRQRALGHTDDQDMPDGTGADIELRALALVRFDVQFAEQTGSMTWAHVLREEVAEVLAESEPSALYEELVQVAAVAIRWASALRRRGERAHRARSFAAEARIVTRAMLEALRDERREVTLTQAEATYARAEWAKVCTNGHGKSIPVATPEGRALRYARVLARKRAARAQAAYMNARKQALKTLEEESK
jgi:hypothetical protein